MNGLRFFSELVGYREIPEVACRSIKHELLRQERGHDFNEAEEQVDIHRYLQESEYAGNIDSCRFRFLVVRDPVKRFLSSYGNRVRHCGELSREYIESTCPDLAIDIPVFDPGLGQFIEFYPEYSLVPAIGHHCKPLIHFLEGEDFSYFNRVYRIEDLHALEAELGKKTNSQVSFSQALLGVSQVRVSELNTRQLDFLLDYYQEDYLILHGFYSVDGLWREWKKGGAAKNAPTLGSWFFSDRKTPSGKAKEVVVEKTEPSPFIVWTFRRTGGTNLAHTLSVLSPYDAPEHEPFNRDRVFGSVTRRWMEKCDRDELYKSIDAIISKKITIKHCLEMVPDEINQALLEVGVKYGYRHIFLYREQATDRLLSLNYALTTGIWGKPEQSVTEVSDDVYEIEIDANKLIAHESLCRQKMASIYTQLVQLDANPLSVSFEDLYSSSFEHGSALVRQLFLKLGLDVSLLNLEKLQQLLSNGGQGSKSEYLRFARSDEFVGRCEQLPLFRLREHCQYAMTRTAEGKRAQRLEVWPVLPSIDRGHYILSGICSYVDWQQGDSLCLKVSGKTIPIATGLASPRMAKIYPGSWNSGFSRFISDPFRICVNAELYIRRNGQQSKLLALLGLSCS